MPNSTAKIGSNPKIFAVELLNIIFNYLIINRLHWYITNPTAKIVSNPMIFAVQL